MTKPPPFRLVLWIALWCPMAGILPFSLNPMNFAFGATLWGVVCGIYAVFVPAGWLWLEKARTNTVRYSANWGLPCPPDPPRPPSLIGFHLGPLIVVWRRGYRKLSWNPTNPNL